MMMAVNYVCINNLCLYELEFCILGDIKSKYYIKELVLFLLFVSNQ